MPLETSAESPAPLRQVSQLLSGYIAKLGPIWVEGQVAELNRRPGICFLVLRDVVADLSMQLKCHSRVLDASSAPVTAGARVVVRAKVDFWPATGTLSLEASEIRPVGLGELLAQLERRRQLLAAEGLFDEIRKRRLPFLPGRVGLVTARDSAAERDVVHNARLRWPGVDIDVRYATMQGSRCAAEVIARLGELDRDPDVDVIVIARGGGSTEDLLPFSDEALVRAVSAATTPVVSAIGHEPDTPLLDLVADLRASTPTDAAKRVVPSVADELDLVAELRLRAHRGVRTLLEREQHGLDSLRTRPVLAAPQTMVLPHVDRLADLRRRARSSVRVLVDHAQHDVDHRLARVRALSPRETLRRGYAVLQDADGAVVTSLAALAPGAALSARVADGRADVVVDAVHPDPATPDPGGTP